MSVLRCNKIAMLIGMLSLTIWCGSLSAQDDDSRIDEEGERLRDHLNDQNVSDADWWYYNSIEEAREIARRENKPMFVTFRCVPCSACAGFDAAVAQGSDRIESLVAERFIPVRQVEMKGVDLNQFQFDFDLSWAAMFINADGTVYARYGTQSADGPDAFNSIAGLANTMERVLELHENYETVKQSLADKLGPQREYSTAIEMPGMERTEAYSQMTTRSNCIHCHNIHDAENAVAQRTGEDDFSHLWRFPLPNNIGLSIDPVDGRKVDEVLADSPASEAGLQVGEEIISMEGQPITSIADMQWVLHHLDLGATTVTLVGSESGEQTLALADGWKETDISWRGSIWALSPRLRVWAPEPNDLERRRHNLDADESALLVKWINRGEPGGRAAFQAGLREGDLIVELEGEPFEMSNNQFNVYLKMNYRVGDRLPITIRRSGRLRELSIELVE